jgi:hypothetical protein
MTFVFVQFKEQCLDEACFEQLLKYQDGAGFTAVEQNKIADGCSLNGVDNGFTVVYEIKDDKVLYDFVSFVTNIQDIGAVQLVKTDDKDKYIACFFAKITLPSRNCSINNMISPRFSAEAYKFTECGKPKQEYIPKFKECPCKTSKKRTEYDIVTKIFDIHRPGFQNKYWKNPSTV